LQPVINAFSGTIRLKLQQFYSVVPKGSNSALTGSFVEEVVRGFIKDWISPSLLLHGTLARRAGHDLAQLQPLGLTAKQARRAGRRPRRPVTAQAGRSPSAGASPASRRRRSRPG